jgi:[protein-PII] uridylyltransferase
MLDELYVAAERYFAGAPTSGPGRSEGAKEGVRLAWAKQGDRKFLEHFLSALPERYLYANDPGAIATHAALARSGLEKASSVHPVGKQEPYVELCVLADDRPGLLAMITAAFAHSKVKVLSAQVYSYVGLDGRSRALDLFWVRSGQDAAQVTRLLPALERDLALAMAGQVEPVELATGARVVPRWSLRPTPPVATKVSVDNRSATNHTVIEVITRDRQGLLFWLSSTIQQMGISIALAKINTEGERVADVFYVSDEHGSKIFDEARIEEMKERIGSAIARLDQGG